MFNQKDLEQIQRRGIDLKTIEKQLEYFRSGIDFVKLTKPAIPGDGIEVIDEHEIESFVSVFDQNKKFSCIKFIPASGAASRMFKTLYEAMEQFNSGDITLKNHEIQSFFQDLEKYPFYGDMAELANKNKKDIKKLRDNRKFAEILRLLLSPDGLNYGNLSKGLLKFHVYNSTSRTAFEEHIQEALLYLKNEKNEVKLHFTVSPEHRVFFTKLATKFIKYYKETKSIRLNISFSEQRKSTDTIAVNPDNTPFRTGEDRLLFRPGGHGALLDNLNELDEELVFIGNIDNIAPDHRKALRVRCKKFLGGFLMKKLSVLHNLLERIDKGERGGSLRKEVLQLLHDIAPVESHVLEKSSNDVFNEKAFQILNKPVRVCGMVKNVGEPGGGPFWVEEKEGLISKQIIESSQVNFNDPQQKEIFRLATHFNPVDLVCFIKNYKGETFDLMNYRNPDQGFISTKSQNGKVLKALELPGLWNGSMAEWITWFVEVPLETFSPVKTVFDLMRTDHR